jgi:GTP-binding protein HflX
VHKEGELLATEHTGEGTLLHAKVPAELAAELEHFAVALQG